MDKTPLVSVLIATYNSSKTVIETLNSIKNQTYGQIELIITDDASRDNTVQICKEWLSVNSSRFARVELVESETNTGVGANTNRGLAAAHGEWIKGLGADDILFPNCIQEYVNYAVNNVDYKFFVGKVVMYADEFKEECIIDDDYQDRVAHYYKLPLNEQLKAVANYNFVVAPGLFYNKEAYDIIGGFDPNSLIEDYPFHIKAMEKGYKYYYIDKPLIGYRKTSYSLSSNGGRLFNFRFVKCRFENYRDYGFKYMSNKSRKREAFRYYRYYLIEKMNLNHRNPICSFFYKASGKIQDWIFGVKKAY